MLLTVNGSTTPICRGVDKKSAAKEFWHRSNNVTALSGITRRVYIEDHNGFTVLAWDYGRGYTYDGETYTKSPVLETETKSYAKTPKN